MQYGSPTFFTPMTVFWNGLSNASKAMMVPWVQAFTDAGAKDQSIVVLSNPFGGSEAGIYVRIADPVTTRPTWKLAMPMAALAQAMAVNSTLQVVLNASGSATYASPNVVYANGQVVTGGAIAATTTIVYLISTPPMVQGGVFTVATLPAAATAGAGARSFVSDANSPTFGATVAGGGAVKTPVYSDGTNWKVG